MNTQLIKMMVNRHRIDSLVDHHVDKMFTATIMRFRLDYPGLSGDISPSDNEHLEVIVQDLAELLAKVCLKNAPKK